MPNIIKVPTLGELAYESIKAQILSCRILPGEKINIDQYSAELGVSTTPVREALSKLQKEGLVQYVPRMGWKISKISKQEFRKLQEVKSLLEITTTPYTSIIKYLKSVFSYYLTPANPHIPL